MAKDGILKSIKGKLIVSCQALADEPLHSPFIMGRMALAAFEGGAGGIRANTPEDVKEIKRVVDLPVIGLFKKVYPDSEVYITPTLDEISAMVGCGSEIVAMDATDRLHPGSLSLDDVFARARKKFPDQLFMADCSTLEECLHAQEIGFDLVGTTMRSYTSYTTNAVIPDFDFFRQLKERMMVPFIAEGGIWNPSEAKKAIECGAFAVVVGSAITRPQLITRRYADAVKGF
ncbi:MAG: N-acetylmannosamine-6-phosphate 2-epimerase [Spirochaetales bacterium]|nr:N-acetylmannosamine-6-phosphate 2-epimerase [Spirochaetales bacterium]